jgi:hypothetical protein
MIFKNLFNKQIGIFVFKNKNQRFPLLCPAINEPTDPKRCKSEKSLIPLGAHACTP